MRGLMLSMALGCALSACAQRVAPAKEKINEEHDWSGSASYVVRTRSGQTSDARYVSTASGSFTEYRMEASLNRGYGRASSSMQINSRYRHTSRIGAGSSTETVTRGTASGDAEADIAVEISDDGTYSFYIPVPPCLGKKYVTRPDGSSEVSDFGEGEAMIQVEAQPLGSDPNILTGEISERTVGENGEVTETILTWSFVKGPLDIELIIDPYRYDTWLPEPGRDENAPGAAMVVNLRLQSKSGQAPKLKAKSFELKLVNTSRHPGVAINYPLLTSGDTKPDMRFKGSEATNEGQELVIRSQDGKSASVVVESFDGAAYTEIQATAILDRGLRVTGIVEGSPGITSVPLPKCRPGSQIAERWLVENGVVDEKEDRDKSPGNNNDGDGLTAFDEYRGVMSAGKFKRLDPRVKELGIQIDKALEHEFDKGLQLFSKASGVAVVRLYADELPPDRVLNIHRKAGALPQHALVLQDMRLPRGVVGRNEPEAENGKTPKQSIRTVIDLVKIKGLYEDQRKAVEEAGEVMPYTSEDEIANTVAHELAHGVHVTHHGPNSVSPPRTAYPNKTPPFALYGSNGVLLTIPSTGWELDRIGDKIGNESSGDIRCIMAYNARYQWCFRQLPDRTLEYRAVPLLAPGTLFCTSNVGTGINANGYFGNAQVGNCLSQIRVKDK